VIGLGASGLAAVVKLAEQNVNVVGIDAKDCASGAAGQNGGFLIAGGDEEYHDNVERLGREVAKARY